MVITFEWCNNLSNIALASTASPNISCHLFNGLFEVIIVDFFSTQILTLTIYEQNLITMNITSMNTYQNLFKNILFYIYLNSHFSLF